MPLEREALNRFLPWLIAFMVYLAVLALAGVMVLDTLAARWDSGLGGTLTVQIPPAGDGAADARRMEAALRVLRETPGIEHAEAISPKRVAALLRPWLGPNVASGELPLPRLVDVKIEAGAEVDVAALATRLAPAVPDASVDDHGVWLDRLIRLIRSVEALASVALLLMGAATVGTVVFTTRTGLAIHQEVIEVLHVIGAQDDYIARQFANRALTLGLRGGLIGLALAVPTLLAIGYLAARLEAGLLPELILAPLDWAMLALTPGVAAAIAMLTARLTVTRTLARML